MRQHFENGIGGLRPKLLLMTTMKLLVRFRLAPRSMTLDDLDLLKVRILSECGVVSQISEATTSNPYCQRRNCSPLSSDV